MRVVVFFINIGGYHAARLRAAAAACRERGWHMSAVQAVASTMQHPWGNFENGDGYITETLVTDEIRKSMSESEWLAASAPLLVRSLERLRPDAVAIPGWGFATGRAALKWCQQSDATAVLMSDSKHDDAPRKWWKEQLKSRLYVVNFDAALVAGAQHRDYLIELGMRRERIFTGYDVVDNEHFARHAARARNDPASARRRQPEIPTRPYFLVATRLLERKNVLRLVDAFAAYRSEVGSEQAWDMVICGSGEQELEVRERIAAAGLQCHVHLPGFVIYEEVGDWYGLASAFVHPALQEQWGLVINEACAARLPILCSRTVGACHELVKDNENGFVFNPLDVADMMRSLVKMHRLDHDCRRAFGRRSGELVSDFAPSAFGEGLVKAVLAARSWMTK